MSSETTAAVAQNKKARIVFKTPSKPVSSAAGVRSSQQLDGDVAMTENMAGEGNNNAAEHLAVLHTSHDSNANAHRAKQPFTQKLIQRIFEYLISPVDKIFAGQVCKDWYNVSKDKALWSTIDLSHVPPMLVKDALVRALVPRSGAMKIFKINNAALLSFTMGIKPALSSFETVRTLSLANTSNVSYEGVIQIVSTCKSLVHLDLSGCSVSNITLEAISKAPYASQLVELNLKASTLITDEGVATLLSTVQQLQLLDLSWCSELSHVSVEHIVNTAPMLTTLQHLNLRWCRKMAHIGIPLLSHLQQLTWLSVSNIGRGLPKQPEVGLEPAHALVRLPKLEYLDVSGIDIATGAGPAILNTRVPKFKQLILITEKPKHQLASSVLSSIGQQVANTSEEFDGEGDEGDEGDA